MQAVLSDGFPVIFVYPASVMERYLKESKSWQSCSKLTPEDLAT